MKMGYKIYPPYLVIKILFAILMGILSPILIKLNAQFIDLAVQSAKDGNFPSMLFNILVTLLALTFIMYLYWIPGYFIGGKFSNKFREKFHLQIIEKITEDFEIQDIEDNEILNLVHRVRNNGEGYLVSNIDGIISMFSQLISLIGFMIIIYSAGWFYIPFIFIVLIFVVYSSYLCSKKQYRAIYDFSETDRRVEYIEGILSSKQYIMETKIFGTTEFFKKLFVKNFDKSTKLFLKAEVRTRPIQEVVIGFIGNIYLILMYITLLFPLADKNITIGLYMSIITAASGMIGYFTSGLQGSLSSLFLYKNYWKEFEEFLAKQATRTVTMDINTKKVDLYDFKEIEFDNVFFKYNHKESYVIKGFNFKFKKGFHYALIGANGSGKTTLIKLMLGVYQPSKGSIKIDGINIKDISKESITRIFSVAFQDYARYYLTIKDVILMGTADRDLDEEKMENIVRALKFDKVIDNLPNRYDSQLGKLFEHGTDISDGEWQKLILCRTLYSNSKIKILDEPTASLDPQNESRLYKLFASINKKDNLTIFISHRLASTILADEILFLEDGIIKECGTHDELMKQNKSYYEMFTAQKQWYVRD
jgi:ATP-binding cassette subfamily B protein